MARARLMQRIVTECGLPRLEAKQYWGKLRRLTRSDQYFRVFLKYRFDKFYPLLTRRFRIDERLQKVLSLLCFAVVVLIAVMLTRVFGS